MALKPRLAASWLQASTQGLVAELQRRGEAEGAAVLCPVPRVAGGLTEPPIVPRFLAALQVGTPFEHCLEILEVLAEYGLYFHYI